MNSEFDLVGEVFKVGNKPLAEMHHEEKPLSSQSPKKKPLC